MLEHSSPVRPLKRNLIMIDESGDAYVKELIFIISISQIYTSPQIEDMTKSHKRMVCKIRD